MSEGFGVQHPVFPHTGMFVFHELGSHVPVRRPLRKGFDSQCGGLRSERGPKPWHLVGGKESEIREKDVTGAQSHRDNLPVKLAKIFHLDVDTQESIDKVQQPCMPQRYR